MIEKIKERNKKYGISIDLDRDNYYRARISVNLGGICSTRIEKHNKSRELAILNVLMSYLDYIDISFKRGLIHSKIDEVVSHRLIKSISDIGLTSTEIMQKALEVVNKINYINSCILNTAFLPSKVSLFQTQEHITNDNTTSDAQKSHQISTNEKCLVKEIAFEWHKYRLSLCKKTKKNPKPLSQNTVDNCYERLTIDILPFLEKKKILYLSQITPRIIEDMLDSINSQVSKHKAYITLNMLFKYAIKLDRAKDNPLEKVSKPPEKINDGYEDNDDNYIDPSEQDKWLDLFEQENTDMSLLFETILLTRYEN